MRYWLPRGKRLRRRSALPFLRSPHQRTNGQSVPGRAKESADQFCVVGAVSCVSCGALKFGSGPPTVLSEAVRNLRSNSRNSTRTAATTIAATISTRRSVDFPLSSLFLSGIVSSRTGCRGRLDMGARTVVTPLDFFVPAAAPILILDQLFLCPPAPVRGCGLFRGSRGFLSRDEGFRKHVTHSVGPATVVLHHLVDNVLLRIFFGRAAHIPQKRLGAARPLRPQE